MIVLKILLIISLVLLGGYAFIIAISGIYAITKLLPILRKERMLIEYGYEWDSNSDYWENKKLEVSIPYSAFIKWIPQHLQDYLERRASH